MHKGLFTVISGIQEELQVRPFINTDFFVKQITAIIKMYYVLCFMYIWLVKLCCWLEQIFWLVCLILQCTCEAFLQTLLVELLRLHDYSVMLAHTILTQKKLGGGQFFPQPLPCGFSENIFYRERVNPFFLLVFMKVWQLHEFFWLEDNNMVLTKQFILQYDVLSFFYSSLYFCILFYM